MEIIEFYDEDGNLKIKTEHYTYTIYLETEQDEEGRIIDVKLAMY